VLRHRRACPLRLSKEGTSGRRCAHPFTRRRAGAVLAAFGSERQTETIRRARTEGGDRSVRGEPGHGRAGKTTPRTTHRRVTEADNSRVVKRAVPQPRFASKGPEPLGAGSRFLGRAGGTEDSAQVSTRRKPRETREAPRRKSRWPLRWEHTKHAVLVITCLECRRRSDTSPAATPKSLRERAKRNARSSSNGAQLFAVTREARPKASETVWGVSICPSSQLGSEALNECAKAVLGASPERYGPGDSGSHTGCERKRADTNVRVPGAWTRPL